ncbi:MAG: indole-3-glycerol-phosphate synthase [Thermoproteota archaeon]|jgi:Indole-3-glycerol phosphate synthase
MYNFLIKAVESIKSLLKEGYYDLNSSVEREGFSLKDFLKEDSLRIIVELKKKSPSSGIITNTIEDKLPFNLVENGAKGLSFLIERNYFDGSIEYLQKISSKINVPILFKDFVIHKKQVEAAKRAGADIILLIAEIFELGISIHGFRELIDYSHHLGLETIVETNNVEIANRLMDTEADYVGINNRDLKTLEINPDHFYNISSKIIKRKPLVAESGYSSNKQIIRDKKAGADFFLIGTCIMSATDPVEKLRELLKYD